jgi:argininosuccinate lyase
MLWSLVEYGFFDVPDRFCGTSSIMMQKKNLYLTQWIKGAAADTVGSLVTTLMADKAPTGLPILEHKYSRSALDESFRNVQRDLELLAELYPALEINKERMLESAGMDWDQATDVAGMLVREKGIPWRTAHQIVGILVRLTIERDIDPNRVTTELLNEASILYWDQPLNLSPELLQSALDPTQCVARRTLYGGPAPVEVQRRLAEYEEPLQQDIELVQQAKRQVEEGLESLEAAIDTLLSETSVEDSSS